MSRYTHATGSDSNTAAVIATATVTASETSSSGGTTRGSGVPPEPINASSDAGISGDPCGRKRHSRVAPPMRTM